MTDKKRAPLPLENGAEASSLEELQENFSLQAVMESFKNGRLVKWLKSIYRQDMADELEALDSEDPEAEEQLCHILNVPYQRPNDNSDSKEQRLLRLKAFTNEKRFAAAIDNVAFAQDELYDRLDEGCTYIYLCGDTFSIPLAKQASPTTGLTAPL